MKYRGLFLAFLAAWVTLQAIVHINGPAGFVASIEALSKFAVQNPFKVVVGQTIFVMICAACVWIAKTAAELMLKTGPGTGIVVAIAVALSGAAAYSYVAFVIRAGSV
jgi:hypothetical protein